MSELDHGGLPASAVPVVLSYGRHAPDEPPPLEPSKTLDTADTEVRHYRHDGWTPAARAAFLETLAKSGVVSDACREVQRSSQTAYALRNRDPLFAAGWDAALSMARARLADEVYHRAIHGTVEQIWKDGEIVTERHRHDNRLSIAVLNRLDARCDRAERIGAPTQRLAAAWDAWLAALAEDRIADAEKLLEPPAPPPLHAILGQGSNSALLHQFHQLRAGRALDEAADRDVDHDGEEGDEPRVWIENHSWRTNFVPPGDFIGDEDGDYGDEDYNRQCTPEEWAILDARFPDAFAGQPDDPLAADEAERDAFFAALAEEVENGEEATELEASPPCAHPELVEGSSPRASRNLRNSGEAGSAELANEEVKSTSPQTVRPEPVEGPLFLDPAPKEEQPFDKLRTNGVGEESAKPQKSVSPTHGPRRPTDST